MPEDNKLQNPTTPPSSLLTSIYGAYSNWQQVANNLLHWRLSWSPDLSMSAIQLQAEWPTLMEIVPESLELIKTNGKLFQAMWWYTGTLSAKIQTWSTVAELQFSFKDIGLCHCPNLQDYYLFIMNWLC